LNINKEKDKLSESKNKLSMKENEIVEIKKTENKT